MLHDSAMLGPSHPDTKAPCAVMMIRPYEPSLSHSHVPTDVRTDWLGPDARRAASIAQSTPPAEQ